MNNKAGLKISRLNEHSNSTDYKNEMFGK